MNPYSTKHSRAAGLNDRVEHRLQIGRRAADDVENIAVAVWCSRDRSIVGARLQLVEQPDVFDRDHRLVGEGGDELDLLVVKGSTSGRAGPRHRSYPFTHERNAEDSSNPPTSAASVNW